MNISNLKIKNKKPVNRLKDIDSTETSGVRYIEETVQKKPRISRVSLQKLMKQNAGKKPQKKIETKKLSLSRLSLVAVSVTAVSFCFLGFAWALFNLLSVQNGVMITNTKVQTLSGLSFVSPVFWLTGSALILVGFAGFFITNYFWKQKMKRLESRISSSLTAMQNGDLSETIFIPEDEWDSIGKTLDSVRESLALRLLIISGQYNFLKNFLEQENFKVNKYNEEKLKTKLKELDQKFKEFKIQ